MALEFQIFGAAIEASFNNGIVNGQNQYLRLMSLLFQALQ